MSADHSPDFSSLLPALPAALLLASWPVALAADWVKRRAPDLLPNLALFVAVLLVIDGITTATDYFDNWRRSTDLYPWFQGDVWSLADRALDGGATAIVPTTEDAAAVLDYSFAGASLLHLRVSAGNVERWLTRHLGRQGGMTVTTGVWEPGPYASVDAAQALPFYLAREGQAIAEESQRGYQLYTYRLGPDPDFAAAGQQLDRIGAFEGKLTLTRARWGAAYPNNDRNGKAAAGGTSFWAILNWRADAQLRAKRVALDLVDVSGRRLASADSPLLDAAQERASSWQPGTALTTYHLVGVPATLPPGPVLLEVRVYDARSLDPLLPVAGTPRQSLLLAQGRTTFATAAGALPATMQPVQQPAASRLELLGVEPLPSAAAPGQAVTVQLYWQLAVPLEAPLPVVVGLGERGVTATGRAASDTPIGLPQLMWFDLRVPTDLDPGSRSLWLSLDGSG
jgi:hypothetical protein